MISSAKIRTYLDLLANPFMISSAKIRTYLDPRKWFFLSLSSLKTTVSSYLKHNKIGIRTVAAGVVLFLTAGLLIGYGSRNYQAQHERYVDLKNQLQTWDQIGAKTGDRPGVLSGYWYLYRLRIVHLLKRIRAYVQLLLLKLVTVIIPKIFAVVFKKIIVVGLVGLIQKVTGFNIAADFSTNNKGALLWDLVFGMVLTSVLGWIAERCGITFGY